MRTVIFLIAFSLAAFGQRHKLDEVDAEKPEGKLLQQCLQENDAAKKAALMEQFVQQYPKLEQTPWVLEQLQAYYIKAAQPDQVLATGDKLLALDPGDPEAALQCLKAAESKKDVAQVKKYSDLTFANATKDAATPQPKDADQMQSWKQEVDYAKQVANYADYALFRAAAEARDPKQTIELAEMLTARSPKSEYVTKMDNLLFLAYRQTGANDKAIALAEKVLATDQSDEDMLLVVANSYMEQKKEPQKVHTYSAKIVEVMGSRTKPEGMSDADWTARKNLIIGLAHYMSGKAYFNENKFAPADEELRKALPLVESDAKMKPEVLFLLGYSNYKLAGEKPERAQAAVTYFRACAAIRSPFQTNAANNVKRIQTEYHGIK